MKINTPDNFLNRFTTLPVLLDILSNKRITLIEPDSWEDRNDAYYLKKYKDEKKLETLLACCFSTVRETFHHWKVFANGSSGVCIDFRKDMLLNYVDSVEGVRVGKVQYRLIRENKQPVKSDWPFLKRATFKDECEFRIIYENEKVQEKSKDIPIGLECIRHINLSPWLPKPLVKPTADAVKKIIGSEFSDIRISGSSLLENSMWKKCLPDNPLTSEAKAH
jgi:hypothetical protein